MLEVFKYPDPVLRRPGKPIDVFDAELGTTAKQMLDTMYAQRGVGLAAPQVGLELNLLVLNPSGETSERSEEMVLVNPTYRSRKGSEFAEEGCLSFPGLYAEVERHTAIVIDYRDLTGAEHTVKLEDFIARIVQHEMDHLNGALFVDRLSSIEKLRVRSKLQDMERRYQERA